MTRHQTVQPNQSNTAHQAMAPTPPPIAGTTVPVPTPARNPLGTKSSNNPAGVPITAQPHVNVPASMDKEA